MVMQGKLIGPDLRKVTDSLPEEVLELLRADNGVYLAGGYIRAMLLEEEPKDIDLFFSYTNLAFLYIYSSFLVNKGYSSFTTDNAITFRKQGCKPIQFITRWGTMGPSQLLESFDFTIAQACVCNTVDNSGFTSVVSDSFYRDILLKKLVYTSPKRNEERAGSFLRMLKFLKRGYTADDETIAKVIARASTNSIGESLVAKMLLGNLTKVRTKARPKKGLSCNDQLEIEHDGGS